MAEVQQAQSQEQEVLRVLELVVQALEQVVRVTALEMEQVREQVLELALAVGLVQVPAAEPVLALVPELAQEQVPQEPVLVQALLPDQVLEQG